MTSDKAHDTPAVRIRSDGPVDKDTLDYARTKIDAVVGRAGLPAITGEVRIVRAASRHADHPWLATADLRVGRRQVVVLAEKATGREVVDQLQDRLRRQTDKATHSGHNDRRTVAPPWRGGPGTPRTAEGSGNETEPHPA